MHAYWSNTCTILLLSNKPSYKITFDMLTQKKKKKTVFKDKI